jgi:hypothetical protein
VAAFAGWKFFQFWPTKGQKISWQYSSIKICKRSFFSNVVKSEKQRKVKLYISSVKMSQKVKKNRFQAMNFTTKVSERQFFSLPTLTCLSVSSDVKLLTLKVQQCLAGVFIMFIYTLGRFFAMTAMTFMFKKI